MNSRADLLYEAVGALSVCHTPGLGEVELSGVSKTAVVRSVYCRSSGVRDAAGGTGVGSVSTAADDGVRDEVEES